MKHILGNVYHCCIASLYYWIIREHVVGELQSSIDAATVIHT